jgi:hypothetical protein
MKKGDWELGIGGIQNNEGLIYYHEFKDSLIYQKAKYI